jgi:hypothetical protein
MTPSEGLGLCEGDSHVCSATGDSDPEFDVLGSRDMPQRKRIVPALAGDITPLPPHKIASTGTNQKETAQLVLLLFINHL